jgi:hypothetical protein
MGLSFTLGSHGNDWVKVKVAHVHVVEALVLHAFTVLLGVLSENEPRLLVLVLVMVLARAVGMDGGSDDWFRSFLMLL